MRAGLSPAFTRIPSLIHPDIRPDTNTSSLATPATNRIIGTNLPLPKYVTRAFEVDCLDFEVFELATRTGIPTRPGSPQAARDAKNAKRRANAAAKWAAVAADLGELAVSAGVGTSSSTTTTSTRKRERTATAAASQGAAASPSPSGSVGVSAEQLAVYAALTVDAPHGSAIVHGRTQTSDPAQRGFEDGRVCIPERMSFSG
ncbi:hypothetical protein BCR44DRAFT_372290 [Catenaria anguillulae PL171]|uniref:Uncharacterized protein n=1 Tax=Catenaria anguillulae PL171 TaxID=765915 RepID=A0A1Y2HB22_9FUNG|nr:hypothetical protein BCR44DRAFT_372290 [Catenaria anguillulae PL171]